MKVGIHRNTINLEGGQVSLKPSSLVVKQSQDILKNVKKVSQITGDSKSDLVNSILTDIRSGKTISDIVEKFTQRKN